ncbi:hypothetical protein D3C72_988080 [compost metagenome]
MLEGRGGRHGLLGLIAKVEAEPVIHRQPHGRGAQRTNDRIQVRLGQVRVPDAEPDGLLRREVLVGPWAEARGDHGVLDQRQPRVGLLQGHDLPVVLDHGQLEDVVAFEQVAGDDAQAAPLEVMAQPAAPGEGLVHALRLEPGELLLDPARGDPLVAHGGLEAPCRAAAARERSAR